MKDPLVLGFVLVVVDVVLWRAAFPRHDTVRLLLRLVIFALLSALLFGSALSPFTPAPWPESPGRHLAAQILEVSWWLIGARLLTLSLDAAFRSRHWHRERLFQDVLGALVFLAAVVASLAFVLGLPVTGLVATSGALAIVLGLAIQSTLSDVFAGIVLNTTEPYHIGDWVSVDGVDGKVLEMNWRATHLLTAQGNIVIVPNAVAAKTKITNSSRPVALHGVSIALQISPEERPATVLGALERAVTGSSIMLQTPAPYMLIKKVSINSIEYEVTVYIDDMSKTIAVTNQLYDLCHRHLAAAGIELWPLGVPRPPRRDVADSRQRLLSHVDLFRALQGEELEALSKRLSRHEYEANQVVVKSDAVTDYLMIVESGVVSVVVAGPSGPVESTRLGPGDSIGEAGVLAGLPVQAQITALTRAVIYQLDKADLTPLLKSRPDIGQQMCQLLSQQQDSLRKLNAEVPVPAGTEHTVLNWLREGMRKLHDLTT
ncbi:mechanosensitive ion channel protein MscS [Caballeronia mineralivorans PML1(12)]|uniref:Small-conductance mechanosensitive channel n=1 Tax=Caballeronia mineralivorans PML1(12) TaxID=908627 RepID=A0A0J1CZT4_9BURK|nr:mechanosensitive ion channel family protein [Caballeronia mineralivorans]KLU26040.1 mechanosensitive ion channel protein MscS [Caballeronia mineralivorans PML1(12)]